MSEFLKKIGIILDIIGFFSYLATVESLDKLDILWYSLLLIGVVFQIPAQVKYTKESNSVSYLNRKYLFVLGAGIFLFLIFLTIDEFYF